MRYSAIILLAVLLFSCGHSSPQRHESREPVAPGSGVFTVRFNPVRSLADRPELALELLAKNGWERVAVVDEDPGQPIVDSLLRTMRSSPESTVNVSGELTKDTVVWGRGHASRILEVDAISEDPPESAAP